MSIIDWIVLCGFLLFVVVYGTWKNKTKNVRDYLLANKSTPWFTVALSIMATQASAITFLSTPGQAYVDGMRFVQFYLGLPIAMVILSITAVPLYHKLNIYTAYEYLETRFDLKNRALGAFLFLTQRGLAAGFTIFAPSLILSVLLGWDIYITNFIIGILVMIYTVSGGTKAVNKTHLLQMIIIMTGMTAAFIAIFLQLPDGVSAMDATRVAGKLGRLNAIDFSFDLSNRYTVWSGLIGGTFLMLSYFGTDQSQVQRYLSGSSVSQSRMGLIINGIVKVPMQFYILFIGAMVFAFYQFVTPPVYFNPVEVEVVKESQYADEYTALEMMHKELHEQKQQDLRAMLDAIKSGDEQSEAYYEAQVDAAQEEAKVIKEEAVSLIQKADFNSDGNDTNYIFLSYVVNFLPIGLIGLVLAAILSASMSSTAAELNALASTTVIDIYKRLYKKDASDEHYLKISKWATAFWGVYAIIFAQFANRLGSLIEAVNILGSLFYGTILGIFLVAFYIKFVKGTPTFIAALIAEAIVITCFFFTDIPFLWFNLIGCLLVVFIAMLLNPFFKNEENPAQN